MAVEHKNNPEQKIDGINLGRASDASQTGQVTTDRTRGVPVCPLPSHSVGTLMHSGRLRGRLYRFWVTRRFCSINYRKGMRLSEAAD
jgi:hypothetical protein